MEKKNRWFLEEETKAKVKAMVVAHIDKIANFDIESCSDTRYKVSLGIDYIKEVFDITDKELEYARSIKMTELQKKLSGESSESYS